MQAGAPEAQRRILEPEKAPVLGPRTDPTTDGRGGSQDATSEDKLTTDGRGGSQDVTSEDRFIWPPMDAVARRMLRPMTNVTTH